MPTDYTQTRRCCPACESSKATAVGDKLGFGIFLCCGCKTIFTGCLPDQDQAENYDDYYTAKNLKPPDFIQVRLNEIVRAFDPYRSSNRLLDVGFGAGTLLQTAMGLGWDVFGQEVSAPAVAHAKTLGMNVFHGVLEDSRFPDDHFDVVTASEIIEHLADVPRTLREIARILRPGGLLWATTPSARSLSFRLMKQDWTMIAPPEHTQLYSALGARKMLKEAGFTRVRIETVGLNPAELFNYFCAGSAGEPKFDRVQSGYELNEKLTASQSSRMIKRLANVFLNVLQLGDSMKIFAVKA